MTRPSQGLSSLTPGGGKMRDPGNEVEVTVRVNVWTVCKDQKKWPFYRGGCSWRLNCSFKVLFKKK